MPSVDPLRPPTLDSRGSALWGALATPGTPVARKVLIGEACRLADRLDKLDLLLSGDAETWVALTHDLRTEDYELKIDAAASEARQTAAALRQILSQLDSASQSQSSGGSLEDELEARRTARKSGSTG